MKNTNKYLILGIIVLVGLGFMAFTLTQSKQTTQNVEKKELIPVASITHGHGLSVDVKNPQNVYIATHHGLLLLKDDKKLYQVGDKKDDYMGFSPHPTNANIIFSSGHPETGGNIGFQKSIDGGFSWEKVSDGVNGPVDFHAMAVNPINPDLIFGWYQGAIQRTTDGGKNWEIVSQTRVPIVALAADPKDENVVYAASPQGLMVSKNKGKDWNTILMGFVSTIAINPQNTQKLISYSEKQQLAQSNNGGKSWEKVNADFSGETPLFISFNKQNPNILYLLTEKNSIFKSSDGASSWKKIY
ncbi:hypothetical protein BH11PAT1_BH11PAT1_7900 [soil metagenome]